MSGTTPVRNQTTKLFCGPNGGSGETAYQVVNNGFQQGIINCLLQILGFFGDAYRFAISGCNRVGFFTVRVALRAKQIAFISIFVIYELFLLIIGLGRVRESPAIKPDRFSILYLNGIGIESDGQTFEVDRVLITFKVSVS